MSKVIEIKWVKESEKCKQEICVILKGLSIFHVYFSVHNFLVHHQSLSIWKSAILKVIYSGLLEAKIMQFQSNIHE